MGPWVAFSTPQISFCLIPFDPHDNLEDHEGMLCVRTFIFQIWEPKAQRGKVSLLVFSEAWKTVCF